MIVVVIISILAAVALPALGYQIAKDKVRKGIATFEQRQRVERHDKNIETPVTVGVGIQIQSSSVSIPAVATDKQDLGNNWWSYKIDNDKFMTDGKQTIQIKNK